MSDAPTQAPLEPVPPCIRVRHLWHRYGTLDVLRDVSFDVGAGEIFGFIGPNGAGKTTTIRIMATLLEPMAGRVEVDGRDVAVDPLQVRRQIGYMPDHAGVYEGLTVREYLEFFADAFAVPDLEVVDAVIELTELQNLRERLVPALSKGMKQRLQLARILLHDPKVLILDEPASDLDPRARIEIRDLLLELRELGKTIFLSSHILTELSDVCTSVGILERGRLLVSGPIREIATELDARVRAASTAAVPAGAPRADGAVAASLATGADPTEAARPAASQVGWISDAPGSVPPPSGFLAPASLPPPSQAPPGPPPTPPAAITTGGVPIPAATRKRLKLRVLGHAPAVMPLLVGGGGVLGVEPGANGRLTVDYVGDDRFVADVVRHLVAHGVGVVAVEPERNELERIFLEVTRGELQ